MVMKGAPGVSGGLYERCGVPERRGCWGVVFVLVLWGDERGRSSYVR